MSKKIFVDYGFNLRGLYSGKKTVTFISLLFMVALVFLPFVSVFNGGSFFVQGVQTPNIVVKNEAELLNAINVAPLDKTQYIIGLSVDIVLKSSLEVPSGKNIVLVSVDGFWCLFGANKQNTIVVVGLLTIDGICVTHVKGDTGSGVYVKESGTLTLLSGKISDNTGALFNGAYGGGVSIDAGGSFVMSGGEIYSNKACDCGGGVLNRGSFTLSGGVISNNTAVNGGGVCNIGMGVFVMSGGKISGNTARIGGGVDTAGSHFTLSGGEISGNTAESYCGGVFYTESYFKWSGGVISGNTAGTSGDDTSHTALCSGFPVRKGAVDMGSDDDVVGVDSDRETGGLVGIIMDKLFLFIVAIAVVGVGAAGLFFYKKPSRIPAMVKSVSKL